MPQSSTEPSQFPVTVLPTITEDVTEPAVIVLVPTEDERKTLFVTVEHDRAGRGSGSGSGVPTSVRTF